MKSLFKRKCPHCCQRSINLINTTFKTFNCPSCNGLVKLHFWLQILVDLPYSFLLFYIVVFSPFPPRGTITIVYPMDKNIIYTFLILILSYGLTLILNYFFVPVMAVPEQEGDVSEERKD